MVLSEADERGQRRLFSWGCGLFGQTGLLHSSHDMTLFYFFHFFCTFPIKFIFLFRQFYPTNMPNTSGATCPPDDVT